MWIKPSHFKLSIMRARQAVMMIIHCGLCHYVIKAYDFAWFKHIDALVGFDRI